MWVKILLIFFVFSFLFRTDHSFDQDLGRHIKLGEIITQSGQVPKINLFSYTNFDFPFINTHWLFEVMAYWFSQTVGLWALLFLKVVIILLSVWLTLKIIPNKNNALLLPIGFIFLHVLRERLELRPEIFSFLFTSLSLFILNKFSADSQKVLDRKDNGNYAKLIFFLPLIQLLWVNTHIYFFIGLLLQAIFLIYIGYQHLRFHAWGGKLKVLSIIFMLSVLLSLINPNGLTGFLYPLNVSKNYGYTIVENQTLFFLEKIGFRDPNFIFVKLSWGIIVLSLIVALIRRNFELKNILLAVSGISLSLINVRSFPYLVFLSLPATITLFSSEGLLRPLSRWVLKSVGIIVIVILFWESGQYLSGEYYRSKDDIYAPTLKSLAHGKEALDFVISHNLTGPIFNNFDIGSYIIYRGYPKYQVFVDGRPEAYPKEFFSNIYIPSQSDYTKFKQLENTLKFKTVIFSHTDQTPWGSNFLQSILKDESFKLVFIDDFIVILVKEEEVSKKNLQIIDLANLDPSNYNFENHVSYLRLGLFLLKTQNNLAAKRFIEKAAQIYPSSPVVKSLLSY